MHDRSRIGRVHPAILVLLAAAVAGLAFWLKGGEETVDIPTVDLANAAPGVAERFRLATDDLREAPDDSLRWARVAAVLDVNGLEVEAVPFYQRAIQLDPTDWRWPYCLGVCLRTSDVGSAAEAFRAALRQRSDYLPLIVSGGLAFEQTDQTDEARRWFEAAVELDANCAPALEGLAALALRDDDLAAARRHLTRATRAAPEYAPAWRMLAQVHDRESKSDLAAIARRRAARGSDALPIADPERSRLAMAEGVLPDHRIMREREALARGDVQAAIDEWNAHVALDPTSAVAHKRLCGLAVRARRDDVAKAHLEKALELEPGSAAPHIAYGAALVAAGRTDDALSAFRAGLTREPDSVAVRVHLGSLLCREKKYSEGIRILEQAVAGDPEDADALYNLGVGQLRAKAHSLAAGTFERLADLRPRHQRVFDQWAQALMAAGKDAEAKAVLMKGLAESPLNPHTVNQLAWLLSTARDEAVRDGTRALNAAQRLNDPRTAGPTALYMDTLAAAFAETRDFDQAVQVATRAEEAARRSGDANLADRIKVRIESYRARSAWRGPR